MERSFPDRKLQPGWMIGAPRRLQLAVFLLVGATSLLSVFGIENAELHRRHAALERNAADIAVALRQTDAQQAMFLRASAALLAPQDPVSTADLGQLEQRLKLDYRRTGSLGLGWAPLVPAPPLRSDSRAQPMAVVLDRGTPGGAAALGLANSPEPIRRAAMDAAAAMGDPVATGRIALPPASAQDAQSGYVVYMPVFAPASGPRPGAAAGRLRGYIFMPYQAAALLAIGYKQATWENIAVAAYDGQVAPDRLMARIGNPESADGPLIERVVIANRPWQLVVSVGHPVGLSRLSQISILSGLMAALLLAVLIHMTYQKMDEDRALLEWQASQAGIRNSLTRELNHRVKNTLATVLSIVSLTRRRESDLDSYVASLSGRIRALSATHDLLTSNDWSHIELRQIIVTELAPYLGASGDHVSLDGPDTRLAPNDSLTLGLAVHELATNAAKYGALSTLAGRIAVRWRKLDEGMVEVHWQETGGPTVAAPQKRGFGRELIEKILASELNTSVRLDFAPDGLQCVFRVPLRKPGSFLLRKERQAGP